MKINKLKIAGFLGIALSFTACKDTPPVDQKKSFDTTVMVANYTENLILPNLEAFQTTFNKFNQSVSALTESTDSTTFNTVQKQFIDAYIAYEYTTNINLIQPSLEWSTKINSFPAYTAEIKTAIANNQTTIDQQVGLAELDYLLFAKEESKSAWRKNTSAAQLAFLKETAQKVNAFITKTITDWKAYTVEFNALTGKNDGSAIGAIFNDFHTDLDVRIKKYKIAIPTRQLIGQAEYYPENFEGFYSGTTRTLLEHNLTAFNQWYFGNKKDNTTGVGFDDMLISNEQSSALNNYKNQWINVLKVFNETPNNYAENVSSVKFEDLYKEIAKTIRFVKGDLASATNIQITANSSDGD